RDFTGQLSNIRSVGLRKAWDDSLRDIYSRGDKLTIEERPLKITQAELEAAITPLDEEFATLEDTVWTLSQPFLDSLWLTEATKVKDWMTFTGKDVDSLEMELDYYHGFLFVIEPGAINMAAPQYARIHFKTQLLGDENWSDRFNMQREGRYVEGIVYPDPFFPVAGEAYHAFAAEVQRSDSAVTAMHLAGERAARMIQFAGSRSKDRGTMRIALGQIRGIETFSGTVSLLKEERVDRSAQFVRFSEGKFNVVEVVRDPLEQD
ncbi:hypothetical protein ACFLQV_03415, partial [Calditrichota bacterium]